MRPSRNTPRPLFLRPKTNIRFVQGVILVLGGFLLLKVLVVGYTLAPPPPPHLVHPGLEGFSSSSSASRNKEGNRSEKPHNYYPTSLDEIRSHIPDWALDYLSWHRAQRQQYPDNQLLTHPSAPKVLIYYCTRNCGGLHDRLAPLPNLLFAAACMKRVLLIRWYTPHPLEVFLQPNLVNWTVPLVETWKTRQGFLDDTTDFLQGYNPQDSTYRHALDHAIHALNSSKVMSLMFWGKGPALNLTYELLERSDSLLPGITTMENPFQDDYLAPSTTTSTGVTASPFGHLWHALFRPAPAVQQSLDQIAADLDLRCHDYAATHCRVRHPGRFATKQNPDGKVPGTSADVSGLPWNVPANRDMAIQTALRAVQCTQWAWNQHYPQAQTQQRQSQTQKIGSKTTTMNTLYFLSDSQELVEYIVDRMPSTENHNTNNEMLPKPAQQGTSPLDRQVQLWKESSSTTVVSRNVVQTPATHLDREKKVPKRTHQAAFVDLYLASRAKCLVFGVGNFAYLAARIGGQTCIARHEDFTNNNSAEEQNNWYNQKSGGAPLCPENVQEILAHPTTAI